MMPYGPMPDFDQAPSWPPPNVRLRTLLNHVPEGLLALAVINSTDRVLLMTVAAAWCLDSDWWKREA